MKNKVLMSAVFVIFLTSNIFAQKNDTLRLKVLNFNELKDCFIITTVNEKTSDSVLLISEKAAVKFGPNYEKMVLGKSYDFICVPDNTEPQYLISFVFVYKQTTIWKPGDDASKIPIFAKNATNLYVRKIEVRAW